MRLNSILLPLMLISLTAHAQTEMPPLEEYKADYNVGIVKMIKQYDEATASLAENQESLGTSPEAKKSVATLSSLINTIKETKVVMGEIAFCVENAITHPAVHVCASRKKDRITALLAKQEAQFARFESELTELAAVRKPKP